MPKRDTEPIKIALVGGKTAGPIVPLLAVRQYIQQHSPAAHFVVIDVAGSVGQALARREQLPFLRIYAGKLRRYFSWRNLVSPLLVLIGFGQSLYWLRRHRITHVIGAGGFAQLPVIWAAWLLRRRRHIHQQDIVPTLTNSLCAPAASTISVTFASSRRDFAANLGLFAGEREDKIKLTGNPFRSELARASRTEAQQFFHLDKSWPTVFILGGGSGAQGINQLIYEALPELCQTVQVIHSTGRGKNSRLKHQRYHAFEFVHRADLAYAAADIVVARAGVSTLTELSNLGKIGIIIPMPNSHQEDNAFMLYQRRAAVILEQGATPAALLVRTIRRLLFDLPMQDLLRQNIKTIMPHNSAQAIARIVLSHD